MLSSFVEKTFQPGSLNQTATASVASYFIVDKYGAIKQTGGIDSANGLSYNKILETLPILKRHLDNGASSGVFYQYSNATAIDRNISDQKAIFIGKLPDTEDLIGLEYNVSPSLNRIGDVTSEIVILSLISQAVRAFNRAENLETILKIVLIGVTAGCGLGFNRASILLTCDEQNCLRGALANGPSSPEEASIIWQKLSKGEITLEQMFDDALQNDNAENRQMSGSLQDIVVPLDKRENIFVRAALEKKSMIIDEATLASEENSVLHSMIGPGPIAVVPLIGRDYLQGVLIADNFITRKEITENDLYLLEIFARYASDSIKNFRLYESLEKKITALKRANETIISNRENMIKAERLSVLAEMAGDVAHEIRNPLTIIGGFAKSMLKKMPDSDQNFEYLNIITQQVDRISHSLEKFTSLINYQSASDKICDLAEIVKSAVGVRGPGANFSGFEVAIVNNVNVKTDPDLLRQAFIIVLKQASTIGKENQNLKLSICRRNDKAIVFIDAIDDNNEFASQIYKSFFSGGNQELFKQLSTTLEILKYYRGNIGIESEIDGIKRFYLELPIFKEEQ